MKAKIIFQLGALILGTLFFTSCRKEHHHFCDGDDTVVSTTKVFATGLFNPRGLKFGPDGYLYVAEGGIGGTYLSSKCIQTPPPVGPVTGSTDGSSISRIDNAGVRTTWVKNLPSSQTTAASGGFVSGVADVVFIGPTLYALFSGAGCSHGVPSIPNGVIRVNPDRTWGMIANLSEFQMTHPVKNPDLEDFTPDGNWYSMSHVGDNIYVLEPNHGELDKITPNGNVSRVVDISATFGHIVPTAHAYHDGNFYVGNLDTFPAPHGGSSIYKVTPNGQISVFEKGFNMILGIVFDKMGGLYVLEMTTNNPFPTPGTGDIVRVDHSGARKIIASGLNFPTGITLGPDGKLYVSNWGFGDGSTKGGGQILQISFRCDEMEEDED